MRIVVVGFGSIGKRHLENLRALGVRELLVTDLDPARRAEAKQRGAAAFDALPEALHARPDAVIVATPPASHVSIALAAAEAGSALFIEKPLSDTLTGVRRLLRLIDHRQLVSLVGCNMLFHHGPATIKRLLDEGRIGKPLTALIDAGQYLPDWHPSEDYRRGYSARRALGGGVVLDGIHELDYACWLFGTPRRVFAMGGQVSGLEIDTEDCANILMEFQTGVVAHVHLDYLQRVYGRTCKVIGEHGTVLWDMTDGAVRWYAASTARWTELPPREGYTVNQMYLDEMAHFLNCLRGTEHPLQDVEQAARTLRVALAAKQSMTTGRPQRLSVRVVPPVARPSRRGAAVDAAQEVSR